MTGKAPPSGVSHRAWKAARELPLKCDCADCRFAVAKTLDAFHADELARLFPDGISRRLSLIQHATPEQLVELKLLLSKFRQRKGTRS